MLFSVDELSKIWSVTPIGVVHIGAHKGEESKAYSQVDWSPVCWIEAQTDLVSQLRESLDPSINQVIEATLWGKDHVQMNFKVTNNGQSSSLLDLGEHATDYPEIKVTEVQTKFTKRFDSIASEIGIFDFVNLDVQGAELEVLKGMGREISKAKWIYTEVNKKDVYRECVLVTELDTFLSAMGFRRIATRWCFGKGWGDALYSRELVEMDVSRRIRKTKNQILWNTFQFLVYSKFLTTKFIKLNSQVNK